jgi:hypothetical protein
MDLNSLHYTDELSGWQFANVPKDDLANEMLFEIPPLNALWLYAQIRSLQNSGVGDLLSSNAGKDSGEHCNDKARKCGHDR